MYVFDGPGWEAGQEGKSAWTPGAWTYISLGDGSREVRKRRFDRITAEEYKAMTPDSKADVARWLAEGALTKIKPEKGKE